MKIICYNKQGNQLKREVDLVEGIFGQEPNMPLLAQAVRVFLTNQRTAQPKVKGRSEVRGSGRKIWRQKGTGRARHGDRQAPIFVGGGKAHGPKGFLPRMDLPKKMRTKALQSALSAKAGQDQIKVVSSLATIEPKTKEAVKLLEKIKLDDKKVLLCLEEITEEVKRAFGNLENVAIMRAKDLNPYVVLNAETLVFSKKGLKQLEERVEKHTK